MNTIPFSPSRFRILLTLTFSVCAVLCAFTHPHASAEVTFRADFPGASLGPYRKTADSPLTYEIDLLPQHDEKKLNRQATWFAFEIQPNAEKNGTSPAETPAETADSSCVHLHFRTFPGMYNGRPTRPNWKDALPVWSSDGGESWTHFPEDSCTWDDETRTLKLRVSLTEQKSLQIAYTATYTSRELHRLQEDLKANPRVRQEILGHALGNVPIPLFTVTDFSVPNEQKRHFFVMARQHAWEAHTSWQADGMIRFLAGEEGIWPGAENSRIQPEETVKKPEVLKNGTEFLEMRELCETYRGRESELAAEICRKCVFYVVPVLETNGTEKGMVRFNENGFDVNRRWNEVDLNSEESRRLRPECWYTKKKILELNAQKPLDLVVNLHNDTVTDYCDACGPEELKETFLRLENLMAASRHYDPRPEKLCNFITDPEKAPPTTFSLWWDDRIPTFMMEEKVSKNALLDRFRTVQDSQTRGAWLAAALEKAFQK